MSFRSSFYNFKFLFLIKLKIKFDLSIYMNLNDLYEAIDKEFQPLIGSEEQRQKETTSGEVSAGGVPRPSRPPEPSPVFDPLRTQRVRPPLAPTGIGRGDLDPFAFDPSGRGGMIFDPFQNYDRRIIPTNLPRGAVPPGARFDPFGPPNPDELVPNSSTRVGLIYVN